MKAIDATTLSSEPVEWLNRKIAEDGVAIEGMESYLSSLHLSLTMLAQECADSDDILAGQYLAQMPSLASDIEKMITESSSSVARLTQLPLQQIEAKNPFKEIERITIALEKVSVARKILSRAKRSQKCPVLRLFRKIIMNMHHHHFNIFGIEIAATKAVNGAQNGKVLFDLGRDLEIETPGVLICMHTPFLPLVRFPEHLRRWHEFLATQSSAWNASLLPF